jgi:asparagine synthase (glutamine-hydrolysing)
MSGIAIIWNRDGRPVDPALLVRMTQLMEHRGPDGEQRWTNGSVALGHRALTTTHEDGSASGLLHDEAAGLCLTFDGRVDNRDELLSQLDLGASAGAAGDEQLVLAAYRKWGEDCPAHLLGDFAFGIWDEPRRRLFCARDPLGVRPLFHARVGDTIVCASEVYALFAVPGLNKEPNLAILAARLLRKCVEFDDTLYKGVYRIPLAHSLTVTREGERLRRYWDIDPGHQIRYRSDGEYAEHFRELFFAAVDCRLRSSRPIAALLSGGLDSSSIVCAAESIRKKTKSPQPRLETFSMVYDRLSSCDERPFMDEVLNQYRCKANFHVTDKDLAVASIERHKRYPGLLYSPQGMVLGAMLDEMRDAGFRVLLDGTGGDELAGNGFRHLMALTRRGKWLSLSALVGEYAANYQISPWRLFYDTCFKPALPAPVRALYRLLKSPMRSAPTPGIVPEDALASTGARARMAQAPAIPDFREPVQAEIYAAIFTGWGPTVLTENYELIVAYSGIEMRQPFRDRRLVEFALALPPSQLWRDGWSRFAFRNAMKNIVPERILKRRGKGIFVPLYDAVLAGSQASEVKALAENSLLARLGVADAKGLRNMVQRYQSSPEITSTVVISDLIALELICREMVGEWAPLPKINEHISAENAEQSVTS